MKFTLSWLRDHLDTEASLEALATTLSAIGLEVDGLEDPGEKLSPFVIARVTQCKAHPNADRLQVCLVDTGEETMEVVCGAPNAKAGLIGVFAPLGAYIPGTGITLEKRPVRGVVSNGMLLSERELELSEDHDGIIELDDTHAKSIGQRYIDVMGVNDPVIEISLTPNRPDCTGVRGIARDLAAAGLGKLKPERKLGKVEGDYACPIEIRLDFEDDAAGACPVFAGRYVRGVKNRPSPAWMQARLRAVGLRPINALVDVTNYISQDRGRPLHVYDADKLDGDIRARLGKSGEGFAALDGKDYAVGEAMTVIADDRKVLGFGGVIGGEETGCTERTKNVFIECAYFDPVRTATTGRTTGISSDARYRFERGVDPGSVMPGLDLATDLVLKLAGGKASKARVAGRPPLKNTVIEFKPARVAQLTGLALKDAQIIKILKCLGFDIAGKGKTLSVSVPGWRPDVHGSADLVEEVVRIAGLDLVPATPLPRGHGVARAVLTERQKRLRRARRLLAGRGLVEAITWSFIPQSQATHFGGGQEALRLANPISVEMSTMRPSLLAGLLTAAQRNRNHGAKDVAMFELGQAYRGDAPEDQFAVAAGMRIGTAKIGGAGRHWDGAATGVDLMDAKGDALALLAGLGQDAGRVQITRDAPAWYHPGRSGVIRLGPKIVLAHFGEMHPASLAELDVDGPAAVFEVFLDALPAARKKASRAKPALAGSNLQPVHRDFAFVLDKAVPAGDVLRAARGADKALIASVSVVDLFEGGELGADLKSLAIEVTLQPSDRTLTDADIEAVTTKVVAAVSKATGGEIRK